MRAIVCQVVAVLSAAFVALGSSAALVDRGGGLIYDTDHDITFLSDPNLARGSMYDDGDSLCDGRMTLSSALAWASDLTFGGFTEWRLPSVPLRDPTCSNDNTAVNYGLGCSGNELGQLFYTEFLAVAGQPVSASGSPYLAYFGLIADEPGAAGYWFDSPWCCGNFAFFSFAGGELSYGVEQNQHFAWAVHDGDIGRIGVITEPSTAILAALALLLIARDGRRRCTLWSPSAVQERKRH